MGFAAFQVSVQLRIPGTTKPAKGVKLFRRGARVFECKKMFGEGSLEDSSSARVGAHQDRSLVSRIQNRPLVRRMRNTFADCDKPGAHLHCISPKSNCRDHTAGICDPSSRHYGQRHGACHLRKQGKQRKRLSSLQSARLDALSYYRVHACRLCLASLIYRRDHMQNDRSLPFQKRGVGHWIPSRRDDNSCTKACGPIEEDATEGKIEWDVYCKGFAGQLPHPFDLVFEVCDWIAVLCHPGIRAYRTQCPCIRHCSGKFRVGQPQHAGLNQRQLDSKEARNGVFLRQRNIET